MSYSECLAQLTSNQTRAALTYWNEKRGSRPCPARDEIDPAEMIKFLPNILLLDIEQDPLDFVYRLVGTEIDRHMSQPYTGLRMSALPHQRSPSNIWQNCAEVAQFLIPRAHTVPYIGPHRDFITCEDVTMPLAPDDKHADRLLIAVAFIPAKRRA